MLKRSLGLAGTCGVGVLISTLAIGATQAADFSKKAPPIAHPYADDFWTRPYLLGDLGRTALKERGVTLNLDVGDEAVGNLSGGYRNTATHAGQIAFTAIFDMDKLANFHGGSFGIQLVQRFGHNLNDEAGIPALQLTNEVFGRGNILRLTQLYYSQKLFDDRLEIKGGRLPVGNDFFFGRCDFLNLTFCGGQPGNLNGSYIYNFPISQWGGVIHYNITPEVQFSIGGYDANPNYLTQTDSGTYALPGIAGSSPGSGVLVPVELTWRPGGQLDGTWRLGGWYDSASTIDEGLPGILVTIPGTGGVPALGLGDQRGRFGGYVSILQRLTNEDDGARGWYMAVNTTVGDHRTSYLDYQLAFQVRRVGTFASRPQDEVGFAVGTSHVNSAAFSPNAGGNEVPLEAWYGWQATGWMNLKFDVQYVINPGGRGFNGAGVKTDNAWVLGLRTAIKL